MSLSPKIGFTVIKSTSVVLYDKTGNYHVSTNPGGFGAPNPLKADISGIILQYGEYGGSLSSPKRLSADEKTAYLNYTGVKLTEGTLSDGVYEVKVLIGFPGAANITALGLSGLFNMVGASTVFANAVGFTIDGLSTDELYLIDRTRTLNGTSGYATSTVPAVTNEPVTVFYEGKVHCLIYDQGEQCLLLDIANADISCDCNKDTVDQLMKRFAQYQSMLHKFTVTLDYSGAHALAKKLYEDCHGGCLPCALYGTPTEITSVCVPPSIIIQPTDVTVNAGNNAAFIIQVGGSLPMTYQWYKNNIAIAGANTASLIILNSTNADEADYKCVVSNACGTIESEVATLDISSALIPVTITQHPQSVVQAAGTDVTFSVVATGSPTITYQWRKNGVNLVGETNSTLNVNDIDSGDEANYDVIVTNPMGSVNSNVATLTLGVTAKVGWRSTLPSLTTHIDTLQSESVFLSGDTIPADFRANAVPQYLILAEPSTEPLKTTWYASVLNNGAIPASGGFPVETSGVLFYELGIIGSYRVYVTFYPTYNTENIIEFRV